MSLKWQSPRTKLDNYIESRIKALKEEEPQYHKIMVGNIQCKAKLEELNKLKKFLKGLK